MSATEVHGSDQSPDAAVKRVDLKLEVVVIPVSDIDRAKKFSGGLGWRLDADFAFDNGVQVVQFTPPGSSGAIQFGAKMTSAAPGSAENLYLIVSDIEVARDESLCGGCASADPVVGGVGHTYLGYRGRIAIGGSRGATLVYSTGGVDRRVDGLEDGFGRAGAPRTSRVIATQKGARYAGQHGEQYMRQR
jgi:predicted enzyme related to lactoylglutathione lyase